MDKSRKEKKGGTGSKPFGLPGLKRWARKLIKKKLRSEKRPRSRVHFTRRGPRFAKRKPARGKRRRSSKTRQEKSWGIHACVGGTKKKIRPRETGPKTNHSGSLIYRKK